MRRILIWLLRLPGDLTWAYFSALIAMRPLLGMSVADGLRRRFYARTKVVKHSVDGQEVSLVFLTPNSLCRFRADSFSYKEPETLEWIDRFGGGGTLYDIGANVGIYSLYYAKRFTGSVVAFEPSVMNLALLAQNIALNGLSDQLVVVPISLTDHSGVADFSLSDTEEGGALSAFGVDFGHDGKPNQSVLSYQTPGLALDDAVNFGLVPATPALIKLDVDGIEHLILRGATRTLQCSTLQSVLVEVNDGFTLLANEVQTLLTSAGFKIESKRHAEMFETGHFASTFNQIWVRL